MSIHLKVILGKILLLSTILGIIFSIGTFYYVNGSQKISTFNNKESSNNLNTFKKSNSSRLGSISVAITTNIGTNYKLLQSIPTSIYKEVLSIEEAMYYRENTKDEIIGKNMLATQEYRNVLKTNIKTLLENTLDRQEVLDAYISQIEFRYENALQNSENLIKQRELFLDAMIISNQRVEEIKLKMDVDFRANDADSSLINIDDFLDEKEKYYFAKSYKTYIEQFLKAYQQLNDYNKNLLDVLINNRDAIIKNTYLVVPDNGGIDSLKAIDLLFEEEEFKSQ